MKRHWIFDTLTEVWTCWEDSERITISCCMLKKAVLRAASKYLESDISSCISHFLILGTKASLWCRKHLQTTSMSTDEASDEHNNQFFQLILDTLSFSSIILSVLSRSPIFGDKMVMVCIENFFFEIQKLTKALISDAKKLQPLSSEILKTAQVVLDAAVKLCRAYFQTIKQESMEMVSNRNEELRDGNEVDYASCVVSMTATTIETLYELGIFAASGGGSLVTILNVSWKSVVFLLQLDKGVLAEKINVGDIILTLISLAIESLRTASETWSTIKEASTVSEAKRMFLPIKFYLINAVRITSEFSCKAVNVYREISRCVLLIPSLGILLSKQIHLKAASEALIEFLEPTSFLLMHTLLNSADVEFEFKVQILDYLFACNLECSLTDMEIDFETGANSLTNIFSIDCDDMPKSELLVLGRVVLFINLLKSSFSLKDEMVCEISKKLDLFLNGLMHENVYSSILSLKIPVYCATGPTPGLTWDSMFSCILSSLKTFLIVASSNKLAWVEVEIFLFDNLFHSHFLCLHIIRELWYFFTRNAEIDVINYIIERLCVIFKIVALSEPKLSPLCSLRKMARSICFILTGMAPSFVDQFYATITSDENSCLSSVMLVTLLLEGFPLDSLSNNLKKLAVRNIITEFYDFVENNSKELRLNGSSGSSDLIGLPVLALSSALHSCKLQHSDIIDDNDISKILKFSVSLTTGFKNAADDMKDLYMKVLSTTLDIISTSKQLHVSSELEELMLELQTIFESNSNSSLLYQCKPSLVSLMVSLSHLEISEGSYLYSAILSLYHVLLKEKHWAFNHLAISAFANFAACTLCSELWRFIPDDAALSFDILTGKDADESNFMAELKTYLEKEAALQVVTWCKNLVLEGIKLRKLSVMPNKVAENSKAQIMEIIDKERVNKKKRKLPDEFCEGMELLQSGLNVMNNALARADSDEVKNMLLPHMSCLSDVILHIASISNEV